jgi:5-methylcytosine-specific restriction endonuclease McrA
VTKRIYISADELLTEGLPQREYKSPQAKRERAVEYQASHRDERRAYFKKWMEANPEKFAAHLELRKQRKRDAGGKYLACEWAAMNDAFGWRCLRCDVPDCESKLVGDHVVPVALGGSSNIENIQPLCDACNRWKSTRSIDFRRLFPEQFVAAMEAVAPFKGMRKSPPSEAARQKIAQALTGYKHDEKTRANMAAGVKDSWTRRGAWASSKSGIRGVNWDSERQRWRASLTVNGRKVKLGRFLTIEEAASHLSEFKELLSVMQGATA